MATLATERPPTGPARPPSTPTTAQEAPTSGFDTGAAFVSRPRGSEITDTHHSTILVIQIHHIHHYPRWWPNPERFISGRFLQNATEPPCSAHAPFGGADASVSDRALFSSRSQAPTFEAPLTLRPKHGLRRIGSRRK